VPDLRFQMVATRRRRGQTVPQVPFATSKGDGRKNQITGSKEGITRQSSGEKIAQKALACTAVACHDNRLCFPLFCGPVWCVIVSTPSVCLCGRLVSSVSSVPSVSLSVHAHRSLFWLKGANKIEFLSKSTDGLSPFHSICLWCPKTYAPMSVFFCLSAEAKDGRRDLRNRRTKSCESFPVERFRQWGSLHSVVSMWMWCCPRKCTCKLNDPYH